MFRIRQPIGERPRLIIGLVSLLFFIGMYFGIAEFRHRINPADQLTPTGTQLWKAAKASVQPDPFTEEMPLVSDLKSSLKLFGTGFLAAVLLSLVLGLHIGSWPWLNAACDPVLKVLSYVPPITLLAYIFLALGIGDTAKIFIIFIATVVPLTRSLSLRVIEIPAKQLWNAETLGASPLEMIWVIARRTVEPGFLEDVRLTLGTAWVYLIVAELIASNRGLGYRINVASRNMNIAQILFYLVVITILAFTMDRALYGFNRWRNRWAFTS